MRKLLKGILLFALVSGLIATPVLAWIVHQDVIGEVSLTVARAEASWELTEIEIGAVDSGAPFSARSTTGLTIANAETLNMTFAIFTLTEDEAAALQGLTVMIGPDEDGDGEMDYPWAEISAIPITLPMPVPPPVMLPSGDYSVIILVEGIAGYPEAETAIGFVVQGTCETLPMPVP